MASDTDILIAIKTTADTAGAEKAKESLSGLEKEVTIVETHRQKTLEETKKEGEDFSAWQASLMAKRKGVTSAMATDIVTAEDTAAAATAKAAAAATNAAAVEEAAAIRSARASAEKAVAAQAAAVKMEAAAVKEAAAAEAAALKALASAERGKKRLAIEAIHSVTPESRQLSAAMAIANNPATRAAALEMAATWAVPVAAVALAGLTANKVFSEMEKGMDDLGKDFKAKTPLISAMIHTLGSPWQSVKEMASAAVSGSMELLDKYVMFGALKSMQLAKQAKDDAAAAKANLAKSIEERKVMVEGQMKHLGEMSSAMYKAELSDQALQIKGIERIISLNSALESVASRRAQNAITMAKQDGGDVALAEANALALSLKTGLADLNGKLADSGAKAKSAEDAAQSAREAYNRGVAQNVKPKELETLNDTVVKAEADAKEAKKDFADTVTKTTAERALLLEDLGIKFRDKEVEYADKSSAAAEKAMDTVWRGLNTAVAEQASPAVEAISVPVGAITTAAKDKATEVSATVKVEREGTVAAIVALAPKAEDTQAVVTAVQDASKALADQGNAIIAALASLQNVVAGITNSIGNQQQQIDNLFSRLR